MRIAGLERLVEKLKRKTFKLEKKEKDKTALLCREHAHDLVEDVADFCKKKATCKECGKCKDHCTCVGKE